MIKVCAKYCGTVIQLQEFPTTEEAEEFMQHDYVLYYADETEEAEDEIIYADEMFIDNDFEQPWTRLGMTEKEWDELPF